MYLLLRHPTKEYWEPIIVWGSLLFFNSKPTEVTKFTKTTLFLLDFIKSEKERNSHIPNQEGRGVT